MNIHHIGYLVKKGPKAQAAFEALGRMTKSARWTSCFCKRTATGSNW